MPGSRHLLGSAGLFLVAAVLYACSDGTGPTPQPPAVAAVEITPAADTLAINATRQLAVTLRDGAGNVLTGRPVTWTSENDAIASVSGEGLVTARTEGSTRITAASEGRTARAEVRVVAGRGVIGGGGGIVASADGRVALEFPAGAVPAGTPITLARANPSTLPSGSLAGTALEFGPSGLQFGQPVRMTIAYDRAALPEGVEESVLRLHWLTDGGWVPVSGSTVDAEAGRVSGLVQGFSVYGVAAAQADLELKMSIAPSPAKTGEDLTHTLLIVNVGPADVTNLEVTLHVLGDVLIKSPGQEGCEDLFTTSPPSKILKCPIASLPAGMSHTLVLRLIPRQVGETLVSTADIAAWQGAVDPDRANNRVQLSTAVEAGASADLSVTMAVQPNPVEVGQDLTHTVTVRNAGPDAVLNPRVRVEVRGQVEFRQTDAACERFGSSNPPARLVICAFASLAAGEARTLQLVVAPGAADQTLTSVASITEWQGPPDLNPANNQVTVSVPVISPPAANAPAWVAVGDGGTAVATSTDGLSWTARQSPLGRGRAVARGNGLWVAVGDLSAADGSVTLATSTDGISWTARTTPFANTAFTVAWNGSRWIAGAAARSGSPTLATSTDGINWTAPAQRPFTIATLGVAWNGQMWVAVGAGGVGTGTTIARSTDGINWTASQSPFGTSTTIERSGWGVAWNGQMWVAVGHGETAIATSTDGINWTARSSPLTRGYGIAWNGQMWVAVGDGSAQLATSTDGITWTARTAPFATGHGVSWNGQLWVATGFGGSARIATSTNGTTWTARSSPFTGAAWNAAPATAPAPPLPASDIRWVVSGEMTGSGTYSSPNGTDWTRTSTFRATAAAYNGSQWLMSASSGSMARSTDGRSWSTAASGLSETYGVAWLASAQRWVAAGTGIATSSDGRTWTTHSLPLEFAEDIACNANRCVAVGWEGTGIATSTDGRTWTAVQTPYTGSVIRVKVVGWNGSYWLAGAWDGKGVVRSTDGVNWTAVAGTGNIIPYSLGTNGTTWMMGGASHQLWVSSDGNSWTPRASPFDVPLREQLIIAGIASSGSQWLLVARSRDHLHRHVAISADGLNWTTSLSGTEGFQAAAYGGP